MTKYGYVRVSTKTQKVSRQINNIQSVHNITDKNFYIDKFTGATMNRTEWQRLMKKVKKGDTIVFDEVSRMSRNAEEGFKVYCELLEKGVNLVFLKEPHCNTDAYKERRAKFIDFNPQTGDKATDTLLNGLFNAINEYMKIEAEDLIRHAFEGAERERELLRKRTKEGMKGIKCGHDNGTKLVTKKSIKAKEEILKYSKDFNGMLNDKECMKQIGIARNTFYKYKAELNQSL